jgi:hypothetical protein
MDMNASTTEEQLAGLPVRHDLTLVYALSLVIALLMTVASTLGLLYPAHVYPSEELQRSFVANDVVNLSIGLPTLLGSMGLARFGRSSGRGQLLGLLFWPGALFYVLYNSIVYALALPLNAGFLLALVLLTLSAYTTVGLVVTIDSGAVRQRLSGAVPERLASRTLVGLGTLFFALAFATLVDGLFSSTPAARPDLALHASDLIVTPAWIIGGTLLWRHEPLGYVLGAGLLFQASTLFIGLIVFLLLQPLLTGATFALVDTVVVSVLGLFCFVPFVLFLRGVLQET